MVDNRGVLLVLLLKRIEVEGYKRNYVISNHTDYKNSV